MTVRTFLPPLKIVAFAALLATFDAVPASAQSSEVDRAQAMRVLQDALGFVTSVLIVAIVFTFLFWVLRAVLDHRAWLRASRVHAEAHAKLFDRLTSNEDLLAYVQSPAGQRFLTAAPAVESLTRPSGAPIARILWSVQAGTVMTLVGIGMFVAKSGVMEEFAQLLHVFAIMAVALGIGFIVSALAAYLLSRQLGRLDPQPRTSHG
jgi:hypothetical protein